VIERIGFGRRLSAAIVDSWIAGFGCLIIDFLGFSQVGQSLQSTGQETTKTPNPAQLADILVPGMTVLFPLYLFVFLYSWIEAFTDASPAKMLLGIKIGNADGTPAARKTLMARFLIKQARLVSTLLAFLTSLSFFLTLGAILNLIIFSGRQPAKDLQQLDETAAVGGSSAYPLTYALEE
jgi:uncharacterized RDD family membrane protein YckC